MTPGDIYKKNLKKGFIVPKQFYNGYEDLHSITQPTADLIGEYQIKQLKRYLPLDSEFSNIIKKLSADMKYIDSDNQELEVDILKTIEMIENNLNSYNSQTKQTNLFAPSKIASEAKANEMRVLKENYNILVNNLNLVYNTISNTNLKSQMIKKEVDNFQENLAKLESQFKQVDKSYVSLSSDNVGFLKSLAWLGRRLKGRYFEVTGVKWISSKLPEEITIVDTANISGPVFNILGQVSQTNKKIRTDIMGFKTNLLEAVTISYILDGKKKTENLNVFLKDIKETEDTKTISLDETNYNELKKALVFGMQAKSGYKQNIFNKFPVSINEAMEVEGLSLYRRQLYLLVSLARINPNIRKTHPIYDGLFNLCLAKGLTRIIGKENDLVMTRDGVQTVRDYMISQWETNKKFVQTVNRINLDRPEKGNMVTHSSKKFD